jgi:hypothetical protein
MLHVCQLTVDNLQTPAKSLHIFRVIHVAYLLSNCLNQLLSRKPLLLLLHQWLLHASTLGCSHYLLLLLLLLLHHHLLLFLLCISTSVHSIKFSLLSLLNSTQFWSSSLWSLNRIQIRITLQNSFCVLQIDLLILLLWVIVLSGGKNHLLFRRRHN